MNDGRPLWLIYILTVAWTEISQWLNYCSFVEVALERTPISKGMSARISLKVAGSSEAKPPRDLISDFIHGARELHLN
jgi:hypothetical protein